MRKAIKPWILAVLFIGFGLAMAAPSGRVDAPELKWRTFNQGVAEAKAKNKLIFLHFSAPWCTYCTKMAKTTFADASVTDYLEENYIPVRVDFDKEKPTAMIFGVRGVPFTWLLTETGERISGLPGYVDAERLLLLLKFVETGSYKTMSLKDFRESGSDAQ